MSRLRKATKRLLDTNEEDLDDDDVDLNNNTAMDEQGRLVDVQCNRHIY